MLFGIALSLLRTFSSLLLTPSPQAQTQSSGTSSIYLEMRNLVPFSFYLHSSLPSVANGIDSSVMVMSESFCLNQ